MKCFVLLSLFVTLGFGFSEFNEYERTPLGDTVDRASMKILKEAFRNSKDKNVIASPLGALTLLSMFSAGIEERCRRQILRLLGSSDYKQLEESYGSLMEKFSSMDPSYLVLANKVYLSDRYTLNSHFSDVVCEAYKSEVEQVDFSQRNKTANSINKWANEKTRGHIKSPVDEQSIDESTALALFNLIFFQGHWNVPFNATETEEKDFHVNELETVKKPMMKLQKSLFYHEEPEIGATMVELPYREKGFRMVIVVPDKKDGLPEVIEKVAQKGLLESVFALKPAGIEVTFEMPRFEIKSNLDLKRILRKLGVSHIFTRGARGVIREKSVAVGKAFQEAFVKVDEEGATAGAFTGFVIGYRSIFRDSLEIKVDHPFMFAILHEDIVLFAGTYTH